MHFTAAIICWICPVTVKCNQTSTYHSQTRRLLSSDVLTNLRFSSTKTMVLTAPKCLSYSWTISPLRLSHCKGRQAWILFFKNLKGMIHSICKILWKYSKMSICHKIYLNLKKNFKGKQPICNCKEAIQIKICKLSWNYMALNKLWSFGVTCTIFLSDIPATKRFCLSSSGLNLTQ